MEGGLLLLFLGLFIAPHPALKNFLPTPLVIVPTKFVLSVFCFS